MLNPSGSELVVCFENTMGMKIPIISIIEASTLLQNGWNGYLMYAMDIEKVPPSTGGDPDWEGVSRGIPKKVEWVTT